MQNVSTIGKLEDENISQHRCHAKHSKSIGSTSFACTPHTFLVIRTGSLAIDQNNNKNKNFPFSPPTLLSFGCLSRARIVRWGLDGYLSFEIFSDTMARTEATKKKTVTKRKENIYTIKHDITLRYKLERSIEPVHNPEQTRNHYGDA